MSKYDKLWGYICREKPCCMTFDEIEEVAGVAIDHSFLTYKKELLERGWCVKRVSMKEQTIFIEALKDKQV